MQEGEDRLRLLTPEADGTAKKEEEGWGSRRACRATGWGTA